MPNTPQVSLVPTVLPEHVFPTLTDSHVRRIAGLGRSRAVQRDDVLVSEGQRQAPFFVVRAGELRIVRPAGSSGETLVGTLRSGQFTGELNMFSNRHAMMQIRASEEGAGAG